MERQRREEWERGKKEELSRRRTGEQEEISRLRAKKKSLELELEAVVSARSSYVFNSKNGLTLRSASRCHRATSTSRSQTASATLRVRGGSSRRRWTSSTRRGTPASQRSTLCSSTLRPVKSFFFLSLVSIIEVSIIGGFDCWLQDWQKKLSLLVPEQQRLTEKLRNIGLSKISRK